MHPSHRVVWAVRYWPSGSSRVQAPRRNVCVVVWRAASALRPAMVWVVHPCRSRNSSHRTAGHRDRIPLPFFQCAIHGFVVDPGHNHACFPLVGEPVQGSARMASSMDWASCRSCASPVPSSWQGRGAPARPPALSASVPRFALQPKATAIFSFVLPSSSKSRIALQHGMDSIHFPLR